MGRALNTLPKLAGACAGGELSYYKARAVAGVATPEDEAIFVDLARQLTGSQLARFCHAYRRAMLAAEPDHDAGHQARRSLQQTWREDGMVRLVALLPPEDGATVIAAINAITGGRPVPEDDPAEDRWSANRAEALVTICEHALATAPEDVASSPASRRLVVNVDVGVLTGEPPDGRCELDGGHPLSKAAALRLGCDCEVVAVIYEGHPRVKGLGQFEPEDGKGGRPGTTPMRWLKTESSIRAGSSWCDSGQAAQSKLRPSV